MKTFYGCIACCRDARCSLGQKRIDPVGEGSPHDGRIVFGTFPFTAGGPPADDRSGDRLAGDKIIRIFTINLAFYFSTKIIIFSHFYHRSFTKFKISVIINFGNERFLTVSLFLRFFESIFLISQGWQSVELLCFLYWKIFIFHIGFQSNEALENFFSGVYSLVDNKGMKGELQ
ncbi:hypothetical protein [Caldibacillus debilis]|uniref:hypothetical protein n=1 Tax=Caldibacillus debilis TaxID=301148 RepID=UPI002AA2B3EE|nr:hypothetical protein [Caldibacillus debilis]